MGAALWIAVALAVSGVAISALFRQHVAVQFAHELVDHVNELQNLAELNDAGGPQLMRPLSDPRFVAAGSGFYWEISVGGRPVLRSPSLGADAFRLDSGDPPVDPHPIHLQRAP